MNVLVKNVKMNSQGEYIGRAGFGREGSPLANPFKVGRDGARGECVTLFDAWLEQKLDAGDAAVDAELRRLAEIAKREGVVRLLCFCAPQACHGDVIARVLRERYA